MSLLDVLLTREIQHPEPSFIHRCHDTDDFIKRKQEGKTTEQYKQRLARQRERYRQGSGIAKL